MAESASNGSPIRRSSAASGANAQSHGSLTDRFIRITTQVEPYSFQAFLLASTCLLVATLLRIAFGWIGTSLPFATYFPAVVIAALLGGIPAGIFVITGTVLIVWWAFLAPFFQFSELDTTELVNLAMFVISSVCILVIAHVYHATIRQLRTRERERDLLLRELEHRGRNTYAVIDAIVRQTLEDDPARADAIAGRIRAINYTNDLVGLSNTHTVFFKDLLAHEFAAFDNARFRATGPDIEMSPHTARQVSLIFHELVTNATKYGALSRPEGQVLLTWQRDGSILTLEWKEVGGPAVTPPTRRGFGTKLVVGCLKSLSGTITPTFAPDGLRCIITFSLIQS